ncbi:MAG TPA: hypothetical protein PLV21_09225 [Cyclobacteriaceae bacterium]|nr:hypothetical protein [Cyclobacteriaceae bacterium]HRJ82052.1 hypothetical protein [Cyclobacteriaceae bacterium]
MGLNEKITEQFDVTTNVSTQDILQRLSDGKQKQTWTDFLVTNTIDYKAININNRRIEIIQTPTVLNAFKPNGRITIDLSDSDDNTTKLKCEVVPFNGNLPILIWLPIGALTLWSLGVLLFSRSFQGFLMIFGAWTAFGLLTYLMFLFNKHGLINYSKRVVKELTQDKKASR